MPPKYSLRNFPLLFVAVLTVMQSAEGEGVKKCFAEFYNNMAIAFDDKADNDFEDKEHADNATHCAQICCGGYKKLNKEATVGNETVELKDFYCDAVMYSPSKHGEENCVLLMCQLRNCSMQLKPEQEITSILLTKQHFEILTDADMMYEDGGMDAKFVAGLCVFLVTFLIFIIILAYFGQKSATRRRYAHTLDDSTSSPVRVSGSKPYYNSFTFNAHEERVAIS